MVDSGAERNPLQHLSLSTGKKHHRQIRISVLHFLNPRDVDEQVNDLVVSHEPYLRIYLMNAAVMSSAGFTFFETSSLVVSPCSC